MQMQLRDRVIVAVHELMMDYCVTQTRCPGDKDPDPRYVYDKCNHKHYIIGLSNLDTGKWIWCAPIAEDVDPAEVSKEPDAYLLAHIALALVEYGDSLVHISDAIVQFMDAWGD